MPKKTNVKSGYSRAIEDAPDRLVTNGKINFGTFNGPIEIVNPLDAAGVFGVPVPRFVKYLRLKEWQAFQLGSEECFMLVVVYNQKGAALTQFIFFDKCEGAGLKYEKLVPSFRVSVPSALGNSRARYSAKNFRIDIHNRLDRGRMFIDVAIESFKKLPDVYGHFEALHDAGAVNPIVVSLPFGANRGMYSHKCLMPMQGELTVGDRGYSFSKRDSFAIVDDHKGYYPAVMKYDWVTGVGRGKKGELIGFNLTDNQVLDKEKYNENCVWVGDRLHLLPPVTFARPDGVAGDWFIKDAYGMVDLAFTPVMENRIDINLLFLKTDYHGPFGTFRGTITTARGAKVPVKNFFGMGEKKYLRG